jgi:hypothetical protein
LIKETEAILDAEKKRLEEKQKKTRQEMEAFVDLNITYKFVDGGKEAWNDVPILFANDRQRYTKSVNSSVTNNEGEILELKNQIQLLKQERSTFESQAKQLQALKKEESKLQLQIKERNIRNKSASLSDHSCDTFCSVHMLIRKSGSQLSPSTTELINLSASTMNRLIDKSISISFF